MTTSSARQPSRTGPPEGIEVKLVALADAANTSSEGKLNLMGIFDIIWARQMPIIWPQMSFVAILGISESLGDSLHFQLRCVNEDGELFGPVIDFDVNRRPGGKAKVPGVAPNFPLVLGIANAVFPGLGSYSFELWWGDKRVCAAAVHVLEPPMQPGT